MIFATLIAVRLLLPMEQISAAPHTGLLNNIEMAQVTGNAEKTQAKFFPEQRIAACWPYDARRSGALSGVAYCKVETPDIKDGIVSFTRGPDLFCSYLRDEVCEITGPSQ